MRESKAPGIRNRANDNNAKARWLCASERFLPSYRVYTRNKRKRPPNWAAAKEGVGRLLLHALYLNADDRRRLMIVAAHEYRRWQRPFCYTQNLSFC